MELLDGQIGWFICACGDSGHVFLFGEEECGDVVDVALRCHIDGCGREDRRDVTKRLITADD